jgi:exopolysaccharide biosynthesis polyprenyl glycosylphosphotransferase
VRRTLLLGDTVVLAPFAVAALSLGHGVLALTAAAVLVFVTVRGASADQASSLLAVKPVVKIWAMVVGLACAVIAVMGFAATGRVLVLGALVMLAALLLLRAALRLPVMRRACGLALRDRRLLVGETDAVHRIVTEHAALADGGEVVSVLPHDGRRGHTSTRVSPLPVDRVVRTAVRTDANQVTVVPGDGIGNRQLRELSWALEGTGIELMVSTDLRGVAPHRVDLTQSGDRLLMRVGSAAPRGWTAGVKSAIDRALALVLLLLAAPVLSLLALAIRFDSRGPALFRQTRVREGGSEFTMYKFRTMICDAEEQLHTLLEDNEHGADGILFKMKHDPRITRLGRLLRRTSLDELPQLINVVTGHMSLIGPRPALPSEVARYDSRAQRRLAVKPGMTGLWQVSGRSRLSWEDSLRYDLDYVDNWSPGRDTQIALKTVKAVLDTDGAY